MIKRPPINNRIRAREVRLIDEQGTNLGVFTLTEALKKAIERNLDLIQMTEKIEPPVCKIMEYGKYFYSLQKKEKKERATQKKVGELKNIRLTFKISPHDLETRAKQAEKFLSKGNKIRIEMRLRGREKALQGFAKEKINQFLELLKEKTPIKIEKDLKKEARGLTIIINKE